MAKFKKLLVTFILFLASCDFKNLSNVEDEYFSEEFYQQKTCIIGDSGTGSSDQYLIAKALEGEGCNNIIHTGDIIYPKGILTAQDDLFEKNFLAPYENLLKTTRFFLTLGNHDHQGEKYSYLDIAKKNPNIILPNFFYLSRFKDSCLLFIDTTLNFRNGQEKWLKEKITQFSTCPSIIVIGHHPQISSGFHGNSAGLIKNFLNLVLSDSVDLYISGHDHQLSLEKLSSKTIQVISGSAAKVRPHKKSNKTIFAISDLGYITIEIINAKRMLLVKKVDATAVAQEIFRMNF